MPRRFATESFLKPERNSQKENALKLRCFSGMLLTSMCPGYIAHMSECRGTGVTAFVESRGQDMMLR